MKRWFLITVVLLLAAGFAWLYLPRDLVSPTVFHRGISGASTPKAETDHALAPPPRETWQFIEPPQQGFKIELPGDPQDAAAPALDDHGRTERVQMIESKPAAQVEYVVCWSDDPPVLRANDGRPDPTLDSARDGMLARTHTAADSELRMTIAGFPAREIFAHNAQGGVLDARLILAGNRLYTLMALFPSAAERPEADVLRFFRSFTFTRSAGAADSLAGAGSD